MSEHHKEVWYNFDAVNAHLMCREVTDRNGNEIVTHVWLVDMSKPKVWVEGHAYKFNSSLLSVRKQKIDRR